MDQLGRNQDDDFSFAAACIASTDQFADPGQIARRISFHRFVEQTAQGQGLSGTHFHRCCQSSRCQTGHAVIAGAGVDLAEFRIDIEADKVFIENIGREADDRAVGAEVGGSGRGAAQANDGGHRKFTTRDEVCRLAAERDQSRLAKQAGDAMRFQVMDTEKFSRLLSKLPMIVRLLLAFNSDCIRRLPPVKAIFALKSSPSFRPARAIEFRQFFTRSIHLMNAGDLEQVDDVAREA